MLDDKKLKMIELVLEGKYTIVEIAKIIPCSRQSIYNWLDEDDVKAEMDIRLQRVRKHSVDRFTSQLEPVIDELYKMAMTAEPRVKVQACKYICDRVLGTPSNNVSIDDNRENKTSEDDIQLAFKAALDRLEIKDKADNVE